MSLIVQYVLIRTDLKWGPGALIAQGCHASVAAIYKSLNSHNTKKYLEDLENMRKVVLKVESAVDLNEMSNKLREAEIEHHLWIENPEKVPTCIALAPMPKQEVQDYFKHLKLFR